MNFAPTTPPRAQRETIVPMINVVFLLLIFFLMTAQIAPPDPFEVTPPGSDRAAPAEAAPVLHVAADGRMAHAGLTGEAALAAIDPAQPLLIRADRALEARELTRLLSRLTAMGVTTLSLVTEAGS